MEDGGKGKGLCASPWFRAVKDSNSLRDRIYDVKGNGPVQRSPSNSSVSGGGPYNRGAFLLYDLALSYFGTRVYITTDHYTIPVDEIDRFLDDHLHTTKKKDRRFGPLPTI